MLSCQHLLVIELEDVGQVTVSSSLMNLAPYLLATALHVKEVMGKLTSLTGLGGLGAIG